MGDIFREVRERVSAQDAGRHYGLTFDRRGWALCPFHADKHPSMSFRNSRYRCWACNASGDSIDLTARLLGLTPLDAVRRLNQDFSLGLPIDRPATAAEQQAARHRSEVAATYWDFEVWKDRFSKLLNACFRTAHTALLSLEVPEDLDRLTPAQVLAIQNQASVEFWADRLAGSIEEQMAVFRDRREVERLCGQILRTMPMKSGAA